MKQNFDGIFPALLTPLNEDKTVNVGALERLLDRVYSHGVDGVYLAGSTGEGLLLGASERQKLVEAAVRSSPPDKKVILHVGASSLEGTLPLLRHASTLPLAAVSSLPPVGSTFPSLLHFYKQLAANTDLPLIVYYFPAVGGELSTDQLLELAQIPGVLGLKYTDYDLYKLSLLADSGSVMFNGRDEVLAAGLLMGAAGGIGSTYNAFPDLYVKLFAAASLDDWTQARACQRTINRAITALLRFPLVPALKEFMSWQDIPCGPSLAAVPYLDAAQRKQLRSSLEFLWRLPV
jgi:N-acetylneuraminate lyase